MRADRKPAGSGCPGFDQEADKAIPEFAKGQWSDLEGLIPLRPGTKFTREEGACDFWNQATCRRRPYAELAWASASMTNEIIGVEHIRKNDDYICECMFHSNQTLHLWRHEPHSYMVVNATFAAIVPVFATRLRSDIWCPIDCHALNLRYCSTSFWVVDQLDCLTTFSELHRSHFIWIPFESSAKQVFAYCGQLLRVLRATSMNCTFDIRRDIPEQPVTITYSLSSEWPSLLADQRGKRVSQ